MTMWAGRWSDFVVAGAAGKGGYQGRGFYVMKWVWYDLLHMGIAYTGLEDGVWLLPVGRETCLYHDFGLEIVFFCDINIA